MRKKKLIRMLTFGMIILLFGCSEDLYEEKNQNEKLKVSHKKFEDLIHQKKFNNAINNVLKIKSNHSIVTKTIMEDQYGFTISDKPVNVIENDSVTSYTLFVTRDSSALNSIENLIIQVNQQNITSAYLLKYTSNSNLPLGNDMKDFEGTKTISPIIYNSNQSSASSKELSYDCNVIQSWFCYGDGHHETAAGCTMGYATYETVCNVIESDGGGGYGNNGSSNTNTGEILTVPHGGGGSGVSQVFPDTPCGRIQKGTSSDKYKQNFKALNKQEKFVLPFESGFAQKKVNGVLSYSYLSAPNGVSLSVPSSSLNYTHVHNNHIITDSNGDVYDSGVKILSPGDVLGLITTCQNASVSANINPTEAFGIMISNEGVFAITLLEPLSLSELGQLNSKWKTFEKKYKEQAVKIITDQSLDASGRKKALQKMLLALLKKAGLENKVGLFEGDVQDNFDSYDINWIKKSLNSTNPNADLIETPC